MQKEDDDVSEQKLEEIFIHAMKRYDAYLAAQQRLQTTLSRGWGDLSRARFSGTDVSETCYNLSPTEPFAHVAIDVDANQAHVALQVDEIPKRRPMHWFAPSEGIRSAEKTFSECLKVVVECADHLVEVHRLCKEFADTK